MSLLKGDPLFTLQALEEAEAGYDCRKHTKTPFDSLEQESNIFTTTPQGFQGRKLLATPASTQNKAAVATLSRRNGLASRAGIGAHDKRNLEFIFTSDASGACTP